MAEPGLRPFSLDNPPLDGLRRHDARRRREPRRRVRRPVSAPGAWVHLLVIGIAGVSAIGAFFGIGLVLLTQTTAPPDTGWPEPAPPPAAAPASLAPAPAAAPTPTPTPASAAQAAKPPAETDRTAVGHSSPIAPPPSDAQPAPEKTQPSPLPPKPAAPAAADPAPAPAPPAKEAATPSPAATTSPAPPPLPPISAAEAARFVHYGEGFLRHAELPAARLFFVAAAAAGDARGALQMGETFDPAARSRAIRGQADPAIARYWYRRAADLGSIEAELRLERLDREPTR